MGVPLKTIKKPPVCISYMPCAAGSKTKSKQNTQTKKSAQN